jgi:hypothetical protein
MFKGQINYQFRILNKNKNIKVYPMIGVLNPNELFNLRIKVDMIKYEEDVINTSIFFNEREIRIYGIRKCYRFEEDSFVLKNINELNFVNEKPILFEKLIEKFYLIIGNKTQIDLDINLISTPYQSISDQSFLDNLKKLELFCTDMNNSSFFVTSYNDDLDSIEISLFIKILLMYIQIIPEPVIPFSYKSEVYSKKLIIKKIQPIENYNFLIFLLKFLKNLKSLINTNQYETLKILFINSILKDDSEEIIDFTLKNFQKLEILEIIMNYCLKNNLFD